MKYIVMDYGDTDIFTKEFDSLDLAKSYAWQSWRHLTDREKLKRRIVVLETINPDEEASNHFDGDIIEEYKEA